MNHKLNVAVLAGGKSSEYEVSLSSAVNVIKALDLSKYNVKPILIDKKGQWRIASGYLTQLPERMDTHFLENGENGIIPSNAGFALDLAREEKVDVVFLAMHGKYGEDGCVQGLLELAGIPYTGSGVLASSLAMDKVKSMELYQFHGLKVPEYVFYSRLQLESEKDKVLEAITKRFPLPVVIKPFDSGSSVAVSIVQQADLLPKALAQVLEVSKGVIAQKYIDGIELTCGVLDCDGAPFALPPTQIIPQTTAFFDYEAKYTPGATREVTPAPLPQPQLAQVQEVALKAHQILGCSGFSRTDMLLQGKSLYILETNTIPGMTQTSLYPQAAKAVGINFSQLLDKLIQNALEKK